jgi:hypothetical protein
MTIPKLPEVLAALHMAPEYYPVLERLLECAGARAADCLQEFALRLLAAREAGASDPAAVALSTVRRWLRRERCEAALLAPIVLSDDSGRERLRPDVLPMPLPPLRVRRQIRWGRRSDAKSAPPPPPPDGYLAAAVRALPTPERNALVALYGIGGRPRRGRRSRELLALAERAVERLREVLAAEHFSPKMS